MSSLPRPAAAPCKSCPYRCDVPSGVWDATEYAKLSGYDGEMWRQHQALFMCHQQDGCLCAGWLACHGSDDLLALRLRPVHGSAYGYISPVPVFASGAEAAAHGMADIRRPQARAQAVMARLSRKVSA